MIPKGLDIPMAYKVPLRFDMRETEEILADEMKENERQAAEIERLKATIKELRNTIWELSVSISKLEDTLS